MKEDRLAAITGFSPDLLLSPHVLPLLMELFVGEKKLTDRPPVSWLDLVIINNASRREFYVSDQSTK